MSKDIQEQVNDLYTEQNKLQDALDIVYDYEVTDSRELKRAIRGRMEEIDGLIEAIENITDLA